MNALDLVTIKGYVHSLPRISSKEDTVRVAIITEDGKEYPILHKGAGTGLLRNINANVEVTGTLTSEHMPGEDDDGPVLLLSVKSFRLTDGFDDPWYDDTAV